MGKMKDFFFGSPFPPKIKTRYRVIDWSKVKTTEDIIEIMSGWNLAKQLKVDEDVWPEWEKFLSDEIEERETYDWSKVLENND